MKGSKMRNPPNFEVDYNTRVKDMDKNQKIEEKLGKKI